MQVQAVIVVPKSQELLKIVKREQALTSPTTQDQHPTECWEGLWTWREHIDWVEFHPLSICSCLMLIHCLSDSKVMTCQLIGKDDSRFDDLEVLSGR